MELFNISNLDIHEKKGNLDVETRGVVSSTKFFPIFEIDGAEYIFKPLSKTKPLTTPLFSYSEVYWSYLINKYIDDKTPLYKLAYCKGLGLEQEKYYDKGCLVKNVLDKDERFINLLELFRNNPDIHVNIDNYVNYCELQYDYSNILKSDFFLENKELRKELAKQILCSVLRRDDNYHYENVSMIEKDGVIDRMAPMIDFEFSQMFLYPDNLNNHKMKYSYYDEGMGPRFSYDDELSYELNYDSFRRKIEFGSIYDLFDRYNSGVLLRNLYTIVELEPELVEDFIKRIQLMMEEVKDLDIIFDTQFMSVFSSYDFEVGKMHYKDGVKEDDNTYLKLKDLVSSMSCELDFDSFNTRLKEEVLWSCRKLIQVINLLLKYNNCEYINIEDYNNSTLYESIKRSNEEDLLKITYQKTRRSGGRG